MARETIPNLFIIGAMKSGTTSLHNYLNEHPEVFMCEPKEPGYFVDEIAWSEGRDWYLKLFADAGNAKIVGESSTHYTKLPVYKGVAEKIHQFNPDAKLIYLMRNPMQRIISHYWHNIRDLEMGESRDIVKAVQQDPQYQGFSDYATQLLPYFELFGKDRVYTLTFEELMSDTTAVVQSIFDWLGVDSSFTPEGLGRQWNSKPESFRQVQGRGLLNKFRYSGLWGAVAPMVPDFIRNIGTHLAVKPVATDEQKIDTTELMALLKDPVEERIAALSTLLDRDFPEWK